MALFFCLVLGASLILVSVWIRAADSRRLEHQVVRAMEAQTQTILARYDQSYREYGLFAFRTDSVNTAVFDRMTNNLAGQGLAVLSQQPVTEANVLVGAVTRYMKGLLPATYFNQVRLRLDQVDQSVGQLELGSQIQTLVSETQKNCLKSSAQELFGAVDNGLEEELAVEAQKAYQAYREEVDPDGDAYAELFDELDFLQPDSLSGFAENLDVLLDMETGAVYRKLCLIEYAIGTFRSGVDSWRSDSGTLTLKDLGGKPFLNMKDSRKLELEKIITGFQSEQAAQTAVKAFITACRTLVHLGSILSDQQQMETIRAAAAACSAAIALISGGTVVLEPETLTYVIAAAKAMGCGLDDMNKLGQGRAVRFWPDDVAVNPKLYYQDYLRVLMLMLPEDRLAERMGTRLEQIIGYQAYTEIKMSFDFSGRVVEWQGGYQ